MNPAPNHLQREPNQPTQSNTAKRFSTEAGQGAEPPETPHSSRARPPLVAASADGEFPTRIGLRLPFDDADAWRAAARARGMNLSDWLRSAVRIGAGAAAPMTGRRTPGRRQPDLSRRRYTQVDPALLFQLSQLGNSVNQIAHRLNGQYITGQPIDVLSSAESLKQIELAMQKILQAHLR